ncbi:MAG: hypothetical protein FJ260_07745 [Planctomycetes bacterium]|nr:hypothetical protein [Planctomycetota bacterium]
MRGERSNIKAGIASLAAVTGLALAIWAWNVVQRSRRVDYRVEFTAEQGVYGIGTGTGVVIGGVARGQVTGIRPRIAGGELKSYEVTLAIDPEVPLYEGMRFRTTAGGINGDAQVEIYDTGRAKAVFGGGVGTDLRRPLDRERVHVATKRDPLGAWFGTEGAGNVDKLLATWWPGEHATDRLAGRLEGIATGVPDRISSLRQDAKDTWKRMSADFDEWGLRYERIAAEAESAIADLGTGKDAAAGSVGRTIADIKDDWAKLPDLRTERAGDIETDFDRASAALKSMMAQVDTLRGSASDLTGAMGEIGAQGLLALQEFDAAYDDALRAPWRLLERPDDAYRAAAEREETVRAFAEAATAHRWALKGIDEALRRDEALMRAEPALAGMLRARLEAANAEFDAHRARMEELLLGPQRPAGAR